MLDVPITPALKGVPGIDAFNLFVDVVSLPCAAFFLERLNPVPEKLIVVISEGDFR